MDHGYENQFLESCKCDNIMIFGGGYNARSTFYFLKKRYAMKIKAFIVTCSSGNVKNIEGIPVLEAKSIKKNIKKTALIIIGVGCDKSTEVEDFLFRMGFENIILSPAQCYWGPIYQDIKDIDFYDSEKVYLNYIENNIFCPSCYHKEDFNGVKYNDMCQIYSVTSLNNLHMANRKHSSTFIKEILAGASLNRESKNYVGIKDNKGDNVSDKNKFLCELSAGYWIWKNDRKHTYVGLYHYSRGLKLKDTDIKKIIDSGLDIVINRPGVFRGNLALLMHLNSPREELVKYAVERYAPIYLKETEEFYNQHIHIPSNMIFCKKGIFDEYYEFMFSIIDKIPKIYEKNNMKMEPRLGGYWGEDLTNIFIRKKCKDSKIKIRFCEMDILYDISA